MQSAPPPCVPDPRPVVDVLVQGRSSVDLTFLGLPELPRMGEEHHATGFAMNPGACFITVNALRRLGLQVGFATELGSDFFSRYVLDRMRAINIDETFILHLDQDLAEVSAGLSFPHDRTFITWSAARATPAPVRGITVADLRDHRVRCLFAHEAIQPAAFAEARSHGIPICIDSFWDPRYLGSSRVWDAIAQADVFMPNLLEALTITGTGTAEAALAALGQRVPRVAIKLGPEGALGWDRGEICRVPVLPVAAVDTTGAGDNFDAGFIYGLLQGLPFEQCLRCAVVAGSLSTLCPGGVAGSADPNSLREGLCRLAAISEAVPARQSYIEERA